MTRIRIFSLSLPSLFVITLFATATNAEVVRTGYTSIVSASSAKCLDIDGASTASGATAVQWHCNFNANEQWTLQPYAGSFRIIEKETGQCLVVPGGVTTEGTQLVQNVCTGSNAELWSFVASGSYFEIVNKSSGQCANVNVEV